MDFKVAQPASASLSRALIIAWFFSGMQFINQQVTVWNISRWRLFYKSYYQIQCRYHGTSQIITYIPMTFALYCPNSH